MNFDIPIFTLFSDFSKLQETYHLKEYIPSVNFIKESKHYVLENPLANIKLTEWNGRLHEVNYTLNTQDKLQIKQIKQFLFSKYQHDFKWEAEIDNGFGEFYESSNQSILGIYAYSLEPTISFLSNESREEETRRRFPNLN
ncbi:MULTISPECIES: hypothetical protein [unclassified Acinetobacter]|uniref:hypothetical protein n=1 Tax=unclassified Acinetobacter TaxID=196816 RepID=UPI00244B4C3E|nr:MULTISPECIES: hypothetical protein [unclassified Acinetobacter]MDH0029698.1 hypothetical protein [Acinetobacter sp. GD04021]MDH0887887.1 hypothetical protein [Acinetobacter sp. GD03873]MDH1081656.1 hypothetical protein [Acinetobacter sp. GD03983]MDH2191255.1 hypothetical protein [Acinetobacter sp. GD03645]MDH2204681.1 hypothetical protein [Acinetobacter sp. GD03647]